MSGLVQSSTAAVLAAALAAGCAFAPASAASEAGKRDADPATFPKRFYRAPGGQLYVPAGTPVRMSIALNGAAEDSDTASVILKEGPNALQLGDVRVPVIADGTPPQTVLEVGDPTHVENGGLRILGPNPKLRLSAGDALSGVARILISADGAAFEPLPAGGGGPVFTVEGVHRLRYYSVDQVGNVEKVQEFAFRLDTSPPHTRFEPSGAYADGVAGVGATLALAAQDQDPGAGVQAIRYRLDDAVEQTYDKPLQMDALSEGTHTLQFHAEDRVGNVETAQKFTWVVDRTPPEMTAKIRGPQYVDKGVRYISPQSEVELTGHDALAGATAVRYRLDAATADVAYREPFRLPERAGIHPLRIESEDPVKNSARKTVNDLYVDLTPPETEVEFSRPFFVRDGEVVLNPGSRIALNSSDFESGVESVTYSLDGGPEQRYGEPFSVTAEGEHRLTVTATDRVGNRAPGQELRLRVQRPANGQTPPPAMDAKRWYQHPKLGLMGPPGLPFELRIAASPDEGAESFLVSAGPAAQSTQEPLAFTVPGLNTLKVAISPKAAGFAVQIDGAPPKTEVTASGARRAEAGGVTYFGPALKLSLASEDDPAGVSSGLWKTVYSLDGSAYATYTAPLDVFSREGAYTFRYYAFDNVGNAESPHAFDFTTDTSPPKTRLELRGPHRANTVAPATHVVLTASDNLSGVAQVLYRIDDGNPRPYSDPFAIGSLSEGPHSLHYLAVDAVGNREEEHHWSFTLQSAVSPASIEVKGNSVERGGTIFVSAGSLIRLKAVEGDSVVYTMDGAAGKVYTAPIPAPETGSHRLSFHAVDDLGNVSESRTLNVVADRTAPNSHLHFEGAQITRESSTIISSETRIVLEAEAGAVGAATLEYSLNGGRWQTYTSPFTIKINGTIDFAYRARNALQTVEAAQKQRLTIDSLGPAIGVSYSASVTTEASTVQAAPGTLLFISAEDAPAGLRKVTYRIDDQPELIYRTPLSGFAPGKTYTIAIMAEDLLGNRSQKTVRVRIQERAR